MPREFRSPIKYIYQLVNRPIEELKKLGLGGGIKSVQEGTGIDIDNTDPLNPIINVIGDGTSTLQSVTNIDNTTTNNIAFSGNSTGLLFDNGSKVQKGTTDSGNGGAKGVAQVCSINYELKWEAGRLYYMEQDGFTIRDVTHNFTFVPQPTDDQTKGFIVGTRWSLDDGTVYVCEDDTIGAAIWNILLKPEDCIPLSGTQSNSVSGLVSFDVTSGGASQYTYANGNIITLGVDYGEFSAISFYDGTANETIYLYLRNGSLYFDNVDTGESTDSIFNWYNQFLNNRVIYSIDTNSNIADPSGSTAGQQINLWNGRAYISNGLNGNVDKKCWSPLPQYYFIDSCSYTQVGTSAPTEDVVFESLIGSVGGEITKAITYSAVGHYHITYTFSNFIPNYQPQANKVKVMATSGNDSTFCLISAQVGQISGNSIQISIFTRSNNGNLTDGIMKGSFIDVYFYV